MTDTRHDPSEDCDGRSMGLTCPECGARPCSCELAYGHDCEVF